jgi:hypothetical protein
MPDPDVELREVIRLLLRASTMYQAQAMSSNAVVDWVLRTLREDHNALTYEDVAKRVMAMKKVSEELIQNRVVALEKVIEPGTPLLSALRTYLETSPKDE